MTKHSPPCRILPLLCLFTLLCSACFQDTFPDTVPLPVESVPGDGFATPSA